MACLPDEESPPMTNRHDVPGPEPASMTALKVIATFFVLPCMAATVSLFLVTRYLLNVEPHDPADEVAWIGDAYHLIQQRHVDAPSPDRLAFSAIDGMVNSLDGYSAFIDPREYAKFREDNEGQYVGIGFRIYSAGPPVTVLCTFPGSPAEQAGLLPGDRIIGVDGEDTTGLGQNDIIEKIKRENGAGQPVALRVQPYHAPGSEPPEPYDVEVVRQNIELQSVHDVHVVDAEKGIGYVRIAAFQEKTSKELASALRTLTEEGVTSLVLDLRRNRGGLLEQAVEVASFFLPPGELVVSTEGRSDNANQRYPASRSGGAYREMKVAVLVDGGSASASEVVAGALQDHMRGVLVGERTYGKGMVQSVIECQYEVGGDGADERAPEKKIGLLKLTTSRYLTPSGRAIDKEHGLTPSVWASLDDEQAPLLDQHFADREISPELWKLIRERTEYQPLAETRFRDTQLERAIEVLDGGRLFNTIH